MTDPGPEQPEAPDGGAIGLAVAAPAGGSDRRPHHDLKHLVFIGMPGSGKSTQAGRLAAHLGIPHVEAGSDGAHAAGGVGQQGHAAG
jgi:hypothetical protein